MRGYISDENKKSIPNSRQNLDTSLSGNKQSDHFWESLDDFYIDQIFLGAMAMTEGVVRAAEVKIFQLIHTNFLT